MKTKIPNNQKIKLSFLTSPNIATMTAATTETTNEGMPHPTLTRILDTPDTATLKLLNTEIRANAMSIESNRGNGTFGHLRIVVSAATYTALAGGAIFDIPNNPGIQGPHAGGDTAAQITQANRLYDTRLSEYKTYAAASKALKSQLMQAVGDTYTKALKHATMGYGLTTPLEIITHLQDTYGTPTDKEILANHKILQTEWNPPAKIEDYFDTIDQCLEYAATVDTEASRISDQMAVTSVIETIKATADFDADIRTWKLRPEAARTFAHLKTVFIAANKLLQESRTTQNAGCGHANAVIQTELELLRAELAALRADQATQAAAANTAQPLATQGRRQPRRPTNPTGPPAVPTPPTQGLPPAAPAPQGYCWTHGHCHNQNHNSATCTYPAEGHQPAATANNRMGGNNDQFIPNFIRRQNNNNN